MMFSKMVAMTTVLAVALTISSVFAAASSSLSWSEYKALHNKKYATPEEDARRHVVYEANMRRAADLAKRNPLATFGATEYADMTPEEFKVYHNAASYYKGYAASQRGVKRAEISAEADAARPDSIDWRTKGAVTYVKNQGQCGSCWSFSTTGNIEGQWFLAGHKLVAVSEQEFVSCDTTDDGCNGGLMTNAFGWLISSRGGWVTSETDYPYVSGAGQVPSCSISGKPNVAQITSYQNFPNDESKMATALSTNGPISIGVDASSWQTYSGGILTDCTSTQVDHGVLLVGYDLGYSTPYWIIKNSWGASWGEQGYIRVAYGSDQCLITTAPSSSISGKGPAPPTSPPSPPSGSGSSGSGSTAPPTPPSGSTFTQYVCPDFLCLDNCKGNTFPQNQCLSLSGGGSAIADCTASALVLNVYSSNDCSGSAQQESQPLDQCLQDESGSYIYNVCSSSNPAARNAKAADASSKVHTMKH